MTNDEKLMQMALNAIEEFCEYQAMLKPIELRDELRARLAQPEPEPVAWMVYTMDGKSVCVTDNPADFTSEHHTLPLYTTPIQPNWHGLTDKERDEIWNKCDPYYDIDDFSSGIEAKLKEKNNA